MRRRANRQTRRLGSGIPPAAAGLSRLSCVSASALPPRSTLRRARPCQCAGPACLPAVPPVDALPDCVVSFRAQSPAGMVAGFRPPRVRLSGLPEIGGNSRGASRPGFSAPGGRRRQEERKNLPWGAPFQPRGPEACAALSSSPGGSRISSCATLCSRLCAPGSRRLQCGRAFGRPG